MDPGELQARDSQGRTLLHRTRDPRQMEALLARGLSPRDRDAQGRTPLMQSGLSAECVRILVAAGADVNARDDQGYTPLYYVAELVPGCIGYCLPDLEPVEALLELGGDPNLTAGRSLTEEAYSMVCSAVEMNEARHFEDFLRARGYTR